MDSFTLHYEKTDGSLGELLLSFRILTPQRLGELSRLHASHVYPERAIRQFLLLDEKSQKKILDESAEAAKDKASAKAMAKALLDKIKDGTIQESDLEPIFSLGMALETKNYEIQRDMVRLMINTSGFSPEQMTLFNSDEFWESVNVEEVRELAGKFCEKLRGNA